MPNGDLIDYVPDTPELETAEPVYYMPSRKRGQGTDIAMREEEGQGRKGTHTAGRIPLTRNGRGRPCSKRRRTAAAPLSADNLGSNKNQNFAG